MYLLLSVCTQGFSKEKMSGGANRDFLKFRGGGGKCCTLALLAFLCHCVGLTSLYTVLFQVNSSAANWLLELLQVMDEMESTIGIKFTTEDITAFQSRVA